MIHKRKYKKKCAGLIRKVLLIIGVVLFFTFLCVKFYPRRTARQYVIEFVRKIDTQKFKSMLNYAMPVIDICYNSGMASISFSGEIQNLLKMLYGIDLMCPQTILNSQFTLINEYNRIKPREPINPPVEISQDDKQQEQEYKQDESSISTEDDYEQQEKQPPQDDNLLVVQKVAIRNETNFKIDIEALNVQPMKLKLNSKGPSILILHTHTTESYSKVYKFLEGNEPGWDKNPKNNVVRVGAELAEKLKKIHGIDVIHNGTVHDQPSYSGSYNRSLNTAQSILKSYPSIKLVIDIHRDALSENKKFRAVKNVNGVNIAQVMLVVGTDQSGLYHPNWKENLKLAIYLQNKLNTMCPGLARPINLRTGRFNQQVSSGALIIEVGGDGNTLEEAIESTAFLAEALGSLK